MAGTKILFSWTLLWLLLAWRCLFIVALPVEVGDDTKFFHAADTAGVYLNSNTKVWNFTTQRDAKLLLSFSRISLERPFDYVTVGEGTIPSPRSEILRWSGEQEEDTLMYLSSTNEIWLTFRKDDSVDSNGFEGNVQKVDEDFILSCPDEYKCGNQVCLTRNDICNGFPNCMTGVDENCITYVVVRPFYNLSSTRSKTGGQLGVHHKYTWVFVTDSDSKLQLSFNFTNTEQHFDFVTVGEGFDPSANLLLSWSGEERKTLPTVTSSTFAMWLTLTTDQNEQSPEAFSASLTQIKESQVTCGSDMLDCMNGVCLPHAYQCDGFIHCGNRRDESNEICGSSPCPFSNRCGDGTCFESFEKCDGSLSCPDMIDESGCRPVVQRLINTTNGRLYKQAFQNHSRTIMFTTSEGRLLVTFYLPLRVTRRTEVSVKIAETSILSNVFDDSHSGFYNIYAGSTNVEFKFSTDSEIYISAIIVPIDYRQRCIDEFDCGNGLCIPQNMYCDGVSQCTNAEDEPQSCEVRNCFIDETVNCTEVDLNVTLNVLDMMNITQQNAPNVAEKLFNVSAETDVISGQNIDSMTDIVLEIVQLEQQAEVGEVTDSVIGIVNNMYNVDSQSIGASTTVGVLPDALERQLGNAASNRRNFTEIMLPNVRAVAAPVNHESLKTGVSFGSSFLANTSREELTDLIHFSPPTIRAGVSSSENLSSYIELPSSIGDKVSTGVNSSVPLSFVIYKNSTIFPVPPESTINGSKVRQVISSQIIAASFANMPVRDLPNEERVMTKFFSFPVASRCETERKHECVFWKYDKTAEKGEWSTDGCEMTDMSENQVTCLCNHLTSFAVLVHVTKESRPIIVVLDIITDIGCVLSIIGLVICVVIIVAVKSVREKQQSHIYFNLCIALIAFYLTFLIGIDRSFNPLGCRIISSFIHFFCLSSMAWMSVEAVLLYNLVNKLRRTDVKYLLPVGMIFAWGVPLLVALVVAFLDKSHDYECFPDYCFLHPGLAMYLGFILLIALMFVFNTVIFLMVSYKFASRRFTATDNEKKRKEVAFRIRGIIRFGLLMGMSWMFGLLAAIPSPLKVVFEILFSILMALQGLAMFYLLIANKPEVQKFLKRCNCFGENISFLSRDRSTTKTTKGSQKSQSNDQSGPSSSVVTDTEQSSSQPQTEDIPT